MTAADSQFQMPRSPEETRKYYDGWEAYYRADENRTAWKNEADEAVVALQEEMADRADLHIADLGCGDGRNLWGWLAQGRRVLGVDIAPTALDHLRETAIARALRVPTLMVGDIAGLPLAAHQFDLVQCYDAVPQTLDPQAVLAEMARVARPGGLVAFNVFTPGDCAYGEGTEVSRNAFLFNDTLFRFFEPEDLRALLPPSLEVLTEDRRRWTDPPHGKFRPYAHTHEALFYVCRKREGVSHGGVA